MHTYDGPLWALLTLRCRYLVAFTRARGFSIILKQPSRSILIPPGTLGVLRVVSRVYIGIARGAQRGKLLLLFRGITLVATSGIPIEKSTTGNEEGIFYPSSSRASA